MKLTGKQAGWTYGGLSAVTAAEHAVVTAAAEGRVERLVEPATSYNVARVQRDVRNGTSNVGLIGTGVIRRHDLDAFAAGGDYSLRQAQLLDEPVRRPLFAVAAVVAAVAALGAQPPLRDGRVFRSTIELTSITATVRDADGRLVTGLPRQAFEVFEDGVAQTVTQFTGERVPVSLAMVLDVSDSMLGRRIAAARTAVERFLMQLLYAVAIDTPGAAINSRVNPIALQEITDGRYHSIRVRVAGGYRVRARSGYVAPARQD